MPESRRFHQVFVGEYPWHPSAGGLESHWETELRTACDITVPVMVTAAYSSGNGSDFDCSDPVGGLVPSSALIEWLEARWHGPDLSYVGKDGQLIFWDPSAREDGPKSLLAHADTFAEICERQDVAIVWIVLGQKQVYPRTFEPNHNFGLLEILGLFQLVGTQVTQVGFSAEFRE